MRINGLSVAPPPIITKVFPKRLEGGFDLVLKFQPVLDLKELEDLLPRPVPPTIKYNDGRLVRDVNDEDFRKAIDKWAQARLDYMILKSLEATPGLTWDKVDMSNPETWGSYREELEQVLSDTEMTVIIRTVNQVSCMDQSMIDEATATFLAMERGQLKGQPSPTDELGITPSGEPVSDSESGQVA